jgi:hypothetical protein
MIEKNLEYENASPEEKARHDEWKKRIAMQGFIPAVNVPELKGRVMLNRNGVQVIETDSKEEGKRIIHALGFTYIEGANVGDHVRLSYQVHLHRNVAMWIGRLVRRSGE